MAQNYKYNKSVAEKFAIKGELSDDGRTINYVDAEKDMKTISVDKCFSAFKGQEIALTITTKFDEDLSDEFEELGDADI